jgi:hypothetical protein
MPPTPSRGYAPVTPAKSPGPGAEVHTVAGQRRNLTCFPNIQHEMYYLRIPEAGAEGKGRLWKQRTPRWLW